MYLLHQEPRRDEAITFEGVATTTVALGNQQTPECRLHGKFFVLAHIPLLSSSLYPCGLRAAGLSSYGLHFGGVRLIPAQ